MSLRHTHLLVVHLSVTNNQIIHKHQAEKNFSVLHPHNFHTPKFPPHKIFHISHALLIFIIFLILCATESVFSV
jgi:hypothetical protein